MSFVVDASALVYANIANEDAAARLRYRLRDETVHATHLVGAGLGNVLRRHVVRGTMTADHGAAVLRHAPGSLSIDTP
ncbi:hypothetical protein EF847_20065 [Actinobacteria bacterium YIM 96077]|uniref:Uncharacterized protein n=1 Tax=Phytoactinopolyspora halophila TaxID=1981511 RepID=A0A329QH02_9ACTN|nr:hypothetical protein [Phytoactinopolyspora halophila]AYY14645.1 hypothetical protein EF847_20065 [Actinobacteria bacterium YIM 96077]RAW11644.1 hypothetical protein DPM12_16385 [Phytoactinopolyspora halophila]